MVLFVPDVPHVRFSKVRIFFNKASKLANLITRVNTVGFSYFLGTGFLIADHFVTSVIDVGDFKNDHEKNLKVDFGRIFNLFKSFSLFSTNAEPRHTSKHTPSDRELNSASFDTTCVLRSDALVEK